LPPVYRPKQSKISSTRPLHPTLESLFETFAGQGVDFLNLPALNMVGVVLALSNEQKLKSQKAYK